MTDGDAAIAGEDAPADDVGRFGVSSSTTLIAALVALGTGLAWATAHPGPAIWWLVFGVVPGWLTVAHLARERRALTVAALGFVLGMAAFLPMLRWLAAPATPVAWVMLAAVQSLWVAAATLAVRPWTTSRWVAVAGPVIWTGMEVVRARVPLTGFGWGDLATAHTDASWMLTTARVLGADGLTLLTALLGALVWVTFVAARPVYDASQDVVHGPTVVPGAARLVAVLDHARPTMMGAVGVAILGTLITAELPAVVGELDVLVVQANDGSGQLTGAAEDLRIAEAHADATVAAVAAGGVPDLTVWAENALDRDPTTEAGAMLRPALQRAADATRGALVTGVIRAGDGAGTFRNSIVAVNAAGEVTAAYDKQAVVPFGEYVPWRSVLGELPPLRQVPRDAIAGPGPVTLDVGQVRIAPVICFETLFGPTVRAAVAADDAGIVVAATNDSSFGRGAESAQHVNQSRLRAVETGRSVVHASISGTSAIIDANGTVLELAPLFEVATIRATVPLATGRTPAMVVAGPLSVLTAALALALTAAGLVRRRSTTTSPVTPEPEHRP